MPVLDKRRLAWQKRKRRAFLVLVVLCVAIATVAGFYLVRKGSQSVYLKPTRLVPPVPSFRASRQTFPYSIVPGGIYEPQDLIDSLRVDPVARDHYKDVRVEDLVPFRLQSPLQAHVSYRIGNMIYWTAKMVTIPRGELMLTDGKNMIRARCGNRIDTLSRRVTPKPPAIDETTLETVFNSGMPSESHLPSYLRPVVPPGTEPPQKWDGAHRELEAVTPELPSFTLYISGLVVFFISAFWKKYGGRNGSMSSDAGDCVGEVL